MSAISLSSKAGEYVCALIPSSSKANRASLTELAEAPKPYSLKIGNTPQFEKALTKRGYQPPKRSLTCLLIQGYFEEEFHRLT